MLLTLAPAMVQIEAFSPQAQHVGIISSRVGYPPLRRSQLNARGDGFDDDEEDGDFVYAGRRSGRRDREEGGYYDDQQNAKSSSKRYQDNVEFFDLDDDEDDIFDDDFDIDRDDIYDNTYNGIIPNPLLDAMDPDGVYERLGPELFKDWTFFRDLALFAAFLAFFTKDTHLYGRFDEVVEGLERLPADFIS